MANEPLSLKQQISVCQQICRLVKAKLPLSGELEKLAQNADRTTAQASQGVSKQLESGTSLTDAIASSEDPQSRSLAACIEAGESSGRLDVALQAWTEIHIRNSTNKQSFVYAMLYPLTLVLLTAGVLAVLMWRLIPDYALTYSLFDTELPLWLQLLVRARENYIVVVLAILVAIAIPLVISWRRGRGEGRTGLPNNPVNSSRQQALSCEVASMLLQRGAQLDDTCRLTAQAAGLKPDLCEQAFECIANQKPVEGLRPETSTVLTSVYSGVLSHAQAGQTLGELAANLHQNANETATRRTRWLPMLVSLSVGGVTLITYVTLIYMPWVLLMQRIASPDVLNMNF